MAAAEAEADREDPLARAALGRAQPGDGGGDVGLDRRGIGLRDVIHVRELVVALADAGGAAEVVERDRGEAALGEAQRELLVEAIQPAHVGEHDDPDRGGVVRRRRERCEARPVGGFEDEILVRDRRAGDARNGRQGVQVEAHDRSLVLGLDSLRRGATAGSSSGSAA